MPLGAGGFLRAHLCRALMEQNLPACGFGRRVLFQEAIEGDGTTARHAARNLRSNRQST
jgi:hypothetical protein